MQIKPLVMWVQNILPVVYDDSLSYLEMVAKINAKTNEIITQTNENTNAIETLAEVISQLGDIDELRDLLDDVETIVEDLYTTDVPLMDGTASAGSADHAARSDHVHPSDTSKAPVNHASSENTYGVGNGTLYGHLKLSNLTDSNSSVNDGIAATPKAVKEVKDAVNDISKYTYSKIKGWDLKTNGKILFVGNSYGQRGTPTYANIVGTNLGLIENTDYWNIAFHGASFVGSSGTPTFLEKLTEWCVANPTEKENIGAIIVVGGVNDARPSRSGQVLTAMATFDEYVKQNLPNAHVFVGFCAVFLSDSESISDRTVAAMRTVLQAYYDSSIYGWTYLNGLETIMLNKTLISSDGLHPSQDGINEIGKAITQALQGGRCNVYKRISTTASPVVEGDAVNMDITSEINNSTVFIILFCRSFTFNTPQTFSLNGWIELFVADLPCNIFTSCELGYYPLILNGVNGGQIQVIARLTYNNTNKHCRAQLRFIDNPNNETEIASIGNCVITATKQICFL